MEKLDLQALGLRALNEKLQKQTDETNQKDWEIINPRGSHAIAVMPANMQEQLGMVVLLSLEEMRHHVVAFR